MIETDITRIATALERIAAAVEGQKLLSLNPSAAPEAPEAKPRKAKKAPEPEAEAPVVADNPPAAPAAPAGPTPKELRDRIRQMAGKLASNPEKRAKGIEYLKSLGMAQVSIAYIPEDKLEESCAKFEEILA